jgi:hypothetical protein
MMDSHRFSSYNPGYATNAPHQRGPEKMREKSDANFMNKVFKKFSLSVIQHQDFF